MPCGKFREKIDVFDGTKVHHEYTQDIIRTESGSGRISEEEERKEILSKSSADETESRSIQKRKDEGRVIGFYYYLLGIFAYFCYVFRD